MSGNEAKSPIEEYIETRFRKDRRKPDPHQKRKRRNAGIIALNAVLVIIMIFIYRSHESATRYYATTAIAGPSQYRFTIIAGKKGEITAGLTIKHAVKGGAPLLINGTVADVTVSHGDNELVLVPITVHEGPLPLEPGKSKSFAVSLDLSAIPLREDTGDETADSSGKWFSFFKSNAALPLTSRLRVYVPNKATMYINFNYEVPR